METNPVIGDKGFVVALLNQADASHAKVAAVYAQHLQIFLPQKTPSYSPSPYRGKVHRRNPVSLRNRVSQSLYLFIRQPIQPADNPINQTIRAGKSRSHRQQFI